MKDNGLSFRPIYDIMRQAAKTVDAERGGMKMCGDQTDLMFWLESLDWESRSFVRVCSTCRYYDNCTREERSGPKSIAGGCDDWIDAETGKPWGSLDR